MSQCHSKSVWLFCCGKHCGKNIFWVYSTKFSANLCFFFTPLSFILWHSWTISQIIFFFSHRRQVWNKMRVSKWWQHLIFGWNIPAFDCVISQSLWCDHAFKPSVLTFLYCPVDYFFIQISSLPAKHLCMSQMVHSPSSFQYILLPIFVACVFTYLHLNAGKRHSF